MEEMTAHALLVPQPPPASAAGEPRAATAKLAPASPRARAPVHRAAPVTPRTEKNTEWTREPWSSAHLSPRVLQEFRLRLLPCDAAQPERGLSERLGICIGDVSKSAYPVVSTRMLSSSESELFSRVTHVRREAESTGRASEPTLPRLVTKRVKDKRLLLQAITRDVASISLGPDAKARATDGAQTERAARSTAASASSVPWDGHDAGESATKLADVLVQNAFRELCGQVPRFREALYGFPLELLREEEERTQRLRDEFEHLSAALRAQTEEARAATAPLREEILINHAAIVHELAEATEAGLIEPEMQAAVLHVLERPVSDPHAVADVFRTGLDEDDPHFAPAASVSYD